MQGHVRKMVVSGIIEWSGEFVSLPSLTFSSIPHLRFHNSPTSHHKHCLFIKVLSFFCLFYFIISKILLIFFYFLVINTGLFHILLGFFENRGMWKKVRIFFIWVLSFWLKKVRKVWTLWVKLQRAIAIWVVVVWAFCFFRVWATEDVNLETLIMFSDPTFYK